MKSLIHKPFHKHVKMPILILYNLSQVLSSLHPSLLLLQLKALVFVPMPLIYLGAKSKLSRCVQPLAWWSTRFVCHWCPLSDNFFSNKRPMGHITHLRNQFKSMNTFEWSYDYIYYKIGPVFRRNLNFVNVLLQFCYYLPM